LGVEESDRSGDPGRGGPPGRVDRPRLRRSPFGYRRADVDAVLDARDAELTVLRQDIAALWLAFAQHDRILRRLAGDASHEPPQPSPKRPEPVRDEPRASTGARAPLDSEAASIGSQLTELDAMLAAIETATRRLEHAYPDHRGEAGATGPAPPPVERPADG